MLLFTYPDFSASFFFCLLLDGLLIRCSYQIMLRILRISRRILLIITGRTLLRDSFGKVSMLCKFFFNIFLSPLQKNFGQSNVFCITCQAQFSGELFFIHLNQYLKATYKNKIFTCIVFPGFPNLFKCYLTCLIFYSTIDIFQAGAVSVTMIFT